MATWDDIPDEKPTTKASIGWDAIPDAPKERQPSPIDNMSGTQQFLAGIGYGMTNIPVGIGQLGVDLGASLGIVSPETQKKYQAYVDERKRLAQPLMQGSTVNRPAYEKGQWVDINSPVMSPGSTGALIGQSVPEILLTRGIGATGSAPRRAFVNALAGAGQGSIYPTSTDDSRLSNALSGGLGGGLGFATGSGLSKTSNQLAGITPLSTMSSGIPERLYASAMKMPLSKRMLKQLPREDINARQRAVEVGMRDRISGDAIGLEQTKRLKKESYQELIDKVNELDAQGYIINTDKILRDGLKDAYKIAKGSNTPVTLKEYIDNFAINYKKQKGLIQSPSSVQENKVFNQTQSNYNMPETISGQKQIDEAITKGIARQGMLILESLSPELKRINRNVSAYKDLEDAISRAIGREMNKDVVGLDTKVMAGKWPLALLNATLGHPKVKTSLAFALDKARNTGAGQFIRTPSNRNTGTIGGRLGANYLLKEQPREQEEY